MEEKNNFWVKENEFIVSDLRYIASDSVIPWERFNNKTVLVTGATGLIGSLLIKALLYRTDHFKENISVVGVIRNHAKANDIFKDLLNHNNFEVIQSDLQKLDSFSLDEKIDFIIHAASNTASKDFVNFPVETILTTINGTIKILDNAKKNDNIESIVYISSIEVYGEIPHETVREDDVGLLDWMKVRSSYPQSKRIAETLCISYFNEYDVPVKIIRPTLTFGPGVSNEDNRVFSQFAKAVVSKTDIKLLTKGETKRDYLYTADCVRGVLSVLLLGKSGEAYNLSNPDSYCSIYEMAQLCCGILDNEISVKVEPDSDKAKCYPKVQRIKLDDAKINSLNKFHKISILEAYKNLISYFIKHNNKS